MKKFKMIHMMLFFSMFILFACNDNNDFECPEYFVQEQFVCVLDTHRVDIPILDLQDLTPQEIEERIIPPGITLRGSDAVFQLERNEDFIDLLLFNNTDQYSLLKNSWQLQLRDSAAQEWKDLLIENRNETVDLPPRSTIWMQLDISQLESQLSEGELRIVMYVNDTFISYEFDRQ